MPYLVQGGHSTWSYREAFSRMHFCAIFDLLLEVVFFKHVCVMDSSAEGTCDITKRSYTRSNLRVTSPFEYLGYHGLGPSDSVQGPRLFLDQI